MDLVYIHRRGIDIGLFALTQPALIAPVKVKLAVVFGCRAGSCLTVESKGIALVEFPAVRRAEVIFIGVVAVNAVNEAFPHPGAYLSHRGFVGLPAVEVARNACPLHVRSPYSEANSAVNGVSAEVFICLCVRALVEKVERYAVF